MQAIGAKARLSLNADVGRMMMRNRPGLPFSQNRIGWACRIAVLFLLSLSATAQAQYNYTTNYTDTNTITITDYTGPGGDVVIPSNIVGKTVTTIGDGVFSSCSNLTCITIPESVTTIGRYAFRYCSSLTHITIPDSVTSIGSFAFNSCSSLTNATIGNGVTDIASSMFSSCSSLTSITIPDSVTNIEHWAFGHCNSLTNVSIGSRVTAIGDNSFYHCVVLMSVTLPDSVTTIENDVFKFCYSLTNVFIGSRVTAIGDSSFYYCYSLTEIAVSKSNSAYSSVNGILFNKDQTILIQCPGGKAGDYTVPDGVTNIGDNAFGECSSLTRITIPDSVTTIGGGAFAYCSSLTNATIGDGVTVIGAGAFRSCSNLTSITIPNSVTNIGYWAFYLCSSLTDVTIPNSVTDIGDRAFGECSSLTEIAVSDSNSAYSSSNGILFNKDQTILIQCPGGKAGNYTVPDSVTNIGDRAFGECASLTEIAVSKSNSAYSSLNGILFNKDQTLLIQCPGGKAGNYTVPDSVTDIGDRAFSSCSSLTRITISDSVTNIGIFAFAYCPSLASVYFMGDAPTGAYGEFESSDSTIYHLPEATGWPPVPDLWADRPTAFWLPEATDDGIFGVQDGEFTFTVSWVIGQTVIVEANTNLTTTNWISVATNAFTNSTFYFSDPEWTNYPGRFYRQRSQ